MCRFIVILFLIVEKVFNVYIFLECLYEDVTIFFLNFLELNCYLSALHDRNVRVNMGFGVFVNCALLTVGSEYLVQRIMKQ